MLFAGIAVYLVIVVLGFFLPVLAAGTVQRLVFWFMAFLVATSQGGIQALSRSYFGKLIPKEQSGEFFGFYNIFGKFAAIVGPFLLAIMADLTGQSRATHPGPRTSAMAGCISSGLTGRPVSDIAAAMMRAVTTSSSSGSR